MNEKLYIPWNEDVLAWLQDAGKSWQDITMLPWAKAEGDTFVAIRASEPAGLQKVIL
jgi:hypothetical protein